MLLLGSGLMACGGCAALGPAVPGGVMEDDLVRKPRSDFLV